MYCEDRLAKLVGHGRLDVALEVTWLLVILLLPLYYNPLCWDSFFFSKSLLFQFLTFLLLGLALARWLLDRRGRGDVNLISWIKQSPLQTAAIGFGIAWIVSTLLSIMPYRSFWGSVGWRNGLISILCWITFFLVVSQNMKSRSQVYRALYVLLISSGLVSAIGILQFTFPSVVPIGLANDRVISTDGNPLSLSAFIAMTIPVNLAMIILNWYKPGDRRKRVLIFSSFSMLLILQFTCLVLAQYSLTILLFVIGIFVFLGTVGIYLQRNSALILSLVALLLIAVVALALLGQSVMPGGGVLPGTTSSGTDRTVAEQAGLQTLGIRTQIWQCVIETVAEAPEIPFFTDQFQTLRRFFGYGPETVIATSQLRFPASLKTRYTTTGAALTQPENHYLYLALTTGIFGLLCFLGVIAVFLLLGFRLLSRAKEREDILVISAVIAAVVQYCAHIFFNPSVIVPDMVFWLMLSLVVVMNKLAADEQDVAAHDCAMSRAAAASAGPAPTFFRKWVAAMAIVVMAMAGAALTVPSMYANMKVREGITLWSQGNDKFIGSLAEAVSIEPQEAYYYGHLGYCAYSGVIAAKDPVKKAALLKVSTAAYEASTGLEPQQAYWHYSLADNYMNAVKDGDREKLAGALKSYQRADVLFPGNAVILNKLALALMLNGDYAEAGRKLSESRDADGEWIQTTYYTGLLDVYERCYCTAGYCFVYPVEQKISNLGPYMSFCGQLALYGGLDRVVEGLKIYTACHSEDWTGQALLGIAEVYDNRLLGAADSFRSAAHNVPPEHAGMLKETVTLMGQENRSFQPTAQDIADSLAGKIPESTK
jgi:O-antigen ligase/tetratricopeptide (TPR) repeat protein